MSHVTVPNRPFATEPTTGFMLPDGIFEATLGEQDINAHVRNDGGSATDAEIFVESVSHPALAVQPRTHSVTGLRSGASRQLSWTADFSGVPPGVHQVSFVAETATEHTRILRKIFVTKTTFDESTRTFGVEVAEGDLQVELTGLVEPGKPCCPNGRPDAEQRDSFLDWLQDRPPHDGEFQFCPPGYLPAGMNVEFHPSPPYEGQYGDLPFQDPWHKVVLCVLTVVLLIAASIAAASEGGSIVVTTEGSPETPPPGAQWQDCCGVDAEGGSSSYVVAGLVAAAAAAATAAGMSDARDPFRRGQDETEPAPGELTTSESLEVEFAYHEPVVTGRPFAVEVDWEYTRNTTGATYTHAVNETNANEHVLSGYEVRAPDVVRTYKREPFDVEAEFHLDGKAFTGDDLFVQCLLVGPDGEHRRFVLQDDGLHPDDAPSDGVYTGRYDFPLKEEPMGVWRYYVVAQDVNDAGSDMDPEEAAKIIGGMVLTDQLEITFDPTEDCPYVADGHVNVV